MFKKSCLSILFAASICSSPLVLADVNEAHIESPMDLMLKVNMNELSDDDRESFIDILDQSGSVPMMGLYSRETVRVMPGSLTAEEGLDFIPDQEQAMDIYLALIEHGALPFAAIFLTNESILSDLE